MHDMSKKIFLFSTRFLEKKAGLFSNSQAVDKAFTENEPYCEFFRPVIKTNFEITRYLFERYFDDLFRPEYTEGETLDGYAFRTQEASILNKKVNEDITRISMWDSEDNEANEDNEDNEDNQNFLPYYEVEEVQKEQNVKKYEITKYVELNKLIEYLKDKEKELPKYLDIDCKLEECEIGWRFRLYKLNLPENCDYAAYAVWSLNEEIKHDENKWYKALYKEIEIQEGLKNNEEVELDVELNFFLHDKDVFETTFDVRHYKKVSTDGHFKYLPEGVKLSVALFQHSNDEIARILSKNPQKAEERLALLKKAGEKIEKAKPNYLYGLMDCISRWTVGGKEEYIKETTKDKLERFPDITLKYTGKDGIPDDASVSEIYADVKQQIDNFESSL